MSKNIFQARYTALLDEADSLVTDKTSSWNEFLGSNVEYVNNEKFIEWKLKVLNLLTQTCGVDSLYLREFAKLEKAHFGDSNLSILKRLRSVLKAAKSDFEGGYLLEVRVLVQAELFSDELDMAQELLASGYHAAAAVGARIVLESAIKELCNRESIPLQKLDKMNADLVKAGRYTTVQQKMVTALAAIGNSAAHGKTEEYSSDQVADMIKGVRKFLSDFVMA
ncbi:DUF4145 domain-containing protein [Herbaspirillum rubrisubalbicans]|uniref:DUF4145 domain-containing protein n=1 Tax=Herbaspirillum rubrisubalbicans TaxID=80842 RepID=UPI00036B2F09|nr:DUF4145 domain-containing protein [Herbaspirillum rubrisubalbicans]